jgi:hypothetical protein
MKTVILIVFGFVFINMSGRCQDKVVLINGDTLVCQVLKMGKGQLTVKDNGIERELNTVFVNMMILENGRQTVFVSIPSSLDFGKGFSVFENSDQMASEIRLLFPNAERREYIIKFPDASSVFQMKSFTDSSDGQGGMYVMDFRTLGYGCNAFLALVRLTDEGMNYIFYSNTISSKKINELIINKTYKLIDSQVVGVVRAIADMTLKPFTMDFQPNGACHFIQDGKETLLEYEISEEGELTFRDGKKRNKEGTTYKVVFLDANTMRYTQFPSSQNIITRKVEIAN